MARVMNEEGVSPVIGVILMVAIAVILAAVIAAFTLGMAGDIETTKRVGATAKQIGTEIIVTYQGGMDALDVRSLTWYIDGDEQGDTLSNATGSTASGTPAAPADKNHVVVVCEWLDGEENVILDVMV